jgi:adenylate kinase family enzyme
LTNQDISLYIPVISYYDNDSLLSISLGQFMHGDTSRIVIVGTSCSGKTMLAKKIAKILGLPHIELDAIYWQPNWDPRPNEEFCALVCQTLTGDRWVVDGNYSVARNIVWGRATTLIWLNYSFPTVFSRALRRTLRRAWDKEILFSGNRESFKTSFLSTDSILLWVLKTYGKQRKANPRIFEEDRFLHLDIFELKNQDTADDLISRFGNTS